MILLFIILTVVALITTIICYSLDFETIAKICFPTTFVLFLITLFTAISFCDKVLNNCKNVISDNYKDCIFVDDSGSSEHKQKFEYEGKIYEATIDYGKIVTKWNPKDVKYTISIIESDSTVNVITSRGKCANCGHTLRNDSGNYCGNCGKKLENVK